MQKAHHLIVITCKSAWFFVHNGLQAASAAANGASRGSEKPAGRLTAPQLATATAIVEEHQMSSDFTPVAVCCWHF